MRGACIALGIVAAFASTQQAHAQSAAFTPAQRAEGEAQIRKAATVIASTARDPSSVSFRNVFIQKRITNDGRQPLTLCGEVNGKNGFGGFTGFQTFILVGDHVYVGTALGMPADYLCRNRNPIIDTQDYSPEMTAAFKAAAGG